LAVLSFFMPLGVSLLIAVVAKRQIAHSFGSQRGGKLATFVIVVNCIMIPLIGLVVIAVDNAAKHSATSLSGHPTGIVSCARFAYQIPVPTDVCATFGTPVTVPDHVVTAGPLTPTAIYGTTSQICSLIRDQFTGNYQVEESNLSWQLQPPEPGQVGGQVADSSSTFSTTGPIAPGEIVTGSVCFVDPKASSEWLIWAPTGDRVVWGNT